MVDDKLHSLKESLRSHDSFLKYLEDVGQSQEFHDNRRLAEKGPHPSSETLYDYVLNWLNEADENKIEEHITYCRYCAEEVISILKMEEESEDEIINWAHKMTLIDRLKELSSSLLLSGRTIILEATRGEIEQGEAKIALDKYHVGDRIVFCVDVPTDGHMAIFHGNPIGQVSWVFPASPGDDTSVMAGSEKRVTGTVTGPPGKHFLKAIYTKNPLVNPEGIDFKNEEDQERTISEFISSVDRLDPNAWQTTIYDFEVLEH